MTPVVLVVDDEPDFEALVLQRFRRRVRDGALSFLFARDGVEALDVLAAGAACDLVVTDINMPRMDGLTLLGRLQAAERTVAAIVVSAYGDMANIRTAMNRGALDFVTKPVDLADLETTIDKALAQVAERRLLVQGKAEAERSRAALGRFFSPALVDLLAADPALLAREGERRVASFLFTDLANFTPLVESAAPTAVARLLNAYLEGVAQCVFDEEGVVVKVFGDAVFAMFGAPLDQPDHARRAVDCALAIDAFARGFEAAQAANGLPLGATRIGVNTGPALVGDFGGGRFFDYTAHGDAIAVAARLEAANKALGTRICVGGATAAAIPGFVGRKVGSLLLRGRREPIAAFEPVVDGADADIGEAGRYASAFALMEDGDARAALAAFAALASRPGDDPLARFHLRRILDGATGAVVDLRGG